MSSAKRSSILATESYRPERPSPADARWQEGLDVILLPCAILDVSQVRK
jgi:hypothetical protein